MPARDHAQAATCIRRYPDLIVHRILKEVLRTAPEKWEGDVPVGVSGVGVSPDGSDDATRLAASETGQAPSLPGSRKDHIPKGHDRKDYDHEHHDPKDHEWKEHEREGHDFSRAELDASKKGASAPEGRRPRPVMEKILAQAKLPDSPLPSTPLRPFFQPPNDPPKTHEHRPPGRCNCLDLKGKPM